jgi:surfeit locus 1 family protein
MKKFFSFKPKLIPTLFTIPALIILLGLSVWQFKRLAWKEALIDEIKTKIEMPVINLPKEVNLDDMHYRKIKAQGEFMHNYEMYVYGGTTKPQNEHFYYVLTPFLTDEGKIIIVNRGWVPEKIKKPESREDGLVQGRVEVVGAVLHKEEKGLYTHDNQPDKNIWFYINLDEMQKYVGKPVEKFYILAQNDFGEFPKGRKVNPNIYNNHLGYALTWLFSAISLLVIYVLYHKRN